MWNYVEKENVTLESESGLVQGYLFLPQPHQPTHAFLLVHKAGAEAWCNCFNVTAKTKSLLLLISFYVVVCVKLKWLWNVPRKPTVKHNQYVHIAKASHQRKKTHCIALLKTWGGLEESHQPTILVSNYAYPRVSIFAV